MTGSRLVPTGSRLSAGYYRFPGSPPKGNQGPGTSPTGSETGSRGLKGAKSICGWLGGFHQAVESLGFTNNRLASTGSTRSPRHQVREPNLLGGPEVAKTQQSGKVIQAWVSPDLARQLKAQADAERRSVSATVRLAIEDRLAQSEPGRSQRAFAAPALPRGPAGFHISTPSRSGAFTGRSGDE
jgi:hypothetical protein